jgi:biotin carboxyl carrier protein
LVAFALAAIGGACSPAGGKTTDVATRIAPPPPRSLVATSVAPAIAAAVASPRPSTAAPAPTAPAAPARVVVEQAWLPVARTGAVTILHPASRVERVGFHESNHDGARHLDAQPTAVAPMVEETRDRGTDPQTAVDIVVDPAAEIRAPVTGTVKRGGGYTLYCKYSDEYLVITPDADPSLEVKLLHIQGVSVRKGQRVIAGKTTVASHATRLPFESDIDDFTADPAWPHVHVEVVDPRIHDRPSPGGGCT